MLALSGDNGWELRSRGKFATAFTSLLSSTSFFTCIALWSIWAEIPGILGAHSSGNRSYQEGGSMQRLLSPQKRRNAWSEDRVGFIGAWQKWPHKGVTMHQNSASALFPRGGLPKLGREECCHSWGPRYGAVEGSMVSVLVIDEDSPPELLPGPGQVGWLKKQQGLPTSDLLGILWALGFLYDPNGRWKGSPLKWQR